MKKILFILTLLMLSLANITAQTVDFRISPDGTFHTREGRNFVVVPFQGKTAHQLFQAIFVNTSEVYKNPKQKVIITIDGSSVNIRAYDPKMIFTQPGVFCGGYYNLNFEIKDGKVKADAPQVDEILTREKDGVREKDFSKLVRSWYQESSLMSRFQDNAVYTEAEFNAFINGVLTGNYAGNSDDDW